MKYKIAYAGCMIVNADSEKEAMDMFCENLEEDRLYDVKKPILAEPCNGDMYDVADDIVDVIADAINS